MGHEAANETRGHSKWDKGRGIWDKEASAPPPVSGTTSAATFKIVIQLRSESVTNLGI